MHQPNLSEGVPCIKIVNENIKLVEEGKGLNLPLSYLNESCDFRKRYNILFDLKYGHPRTEIQKKKYKEYCQSPEYKKKKRKYYQRPDVKKKMIKQQKEYQQRPDVKKKMIKQQKEYQQRPEVKKRSREYYLKRKAGK